MKNLKNIITHKHLRIVALASGFSLFMFMFLPMPTFAARCYVTTPAGEVQKFPTCSVAMKDAGFNLGSLPNPFPEGDGYCILWGADSATPGVQADCNNEKIKNAKDFGSTPVPPPAIPLPPGTTIGGEVKTPGVGEIVGGKVQPVGTTVTGRENCNSSTDCSNLTVIKYINTGINMLSGLVAVIVVIMIVMGGIQYSSAGGNPQATAAAKHRIINAILAFVAYLFLFVFLSWLVPGGL